MICKGVISDMDGVILDSEKLYVRFWCEAARSFGFPMEREHALGIRSLAHDLAEQKLQAVFGKQLQLDTVRAKRIELMDAYVEEHGIEVKPGAEELLRFLKENGFRVALATATPAERARLYLERAGLLQYFDAVVSSRMVPHGKPAPDIYLYAARQLGLPPEACMALEDSPNGIRSAYAAGCKTVMVPDLDRPSEEILPLLYGVAEGLTEVIPMLHECK